MRDLTFFNDIPDLGYEMYMDSCNLEEKESVLIANYAICAEVVKDLCIYQDTGIMSIELIPEDINGYEYEYLLTLDSSKGIWVQPLRDKDGYILIPDDEDSVAIYVHGDVNTQAIKYIDSNKIHPFVFDWDE